jgi:hypothetical protein
MAVFGSKRPPFAGRGPAGDPGRAQARRSQKLQPVPQTKLRTGTKGAPDFFAHLSANGYPAIPPISAFSQCI